MNSKHRVAALKLYGLLAHWDTWQRPTGLGAATGRLGRRRTEAARAGAAPGAAHLSRFKPLADFDWGWPAQCDQPWWQNSRPWALSGEAANPHPGGTQQGGQVDDRPEHRPPCGAAGYSALFINAAQMLGDLAAQDGDNALRRRLKHYARPDVLIIDEVRYLSYGNRHADLLF